MCGFVALIGPGQSLPRNVLEAMRDQLTHRGPDGAGLWQGNTTVGSVSLGFRRLAIIDTRDVADQPMLSCDAQKVVVFNGEIYNFVELRAELQAKGCVFKTRSDTEVLLQAYEHWGEAMVERLNGMFAFVIWDAVKNQAFIARDRLGEKPLFMCRLPDGKLGFASEIKALLAHPTIQVDYDMAMFGRVLAGHLTFGTDETLFTGVHQVRAAHCLRVSAQGEVLADRRYWTPLYDRSLAKTDRTELLHMFRQKLENSVAMRMRSDVPMTACLSGGLDSSSLVSLLTQAQRRQPQLGGISGAVSARFPHDPTIDEGYYIDQVLNHTGLTGYAVTPTGEDLARDLRLLHWHHETIIPGPSMYLEWCVMKQARTLGYKVIIDGQGADEILAGYRCYLQSYQAELSELGLVGLASSWLIGAMRDRRLRRESLRYQNSHRRFICRDSLVGKERDKYKKIIIPQLMSQYGGDGLPDASNVGFLRFDLALNLLKTSLPSNLHSGDRNSMAHGIESRYPFLDYELVDFSTHLPDWAFLDQGWGKAIMRQSLSNALPNDVLWRVDKVGFAAPQDDWLTKPAMKEWLIERIFDSRLRSIQGYSEHKLKQLLLQHIDGSADNSSLLWSWASASELIDMQAQDAWILKKESNLTKSIVSSESGTFHFDLIKKDYQGYWEGTSDGDKIAWIISYTPIAKEPRVIRQAQALIDAGWKVFVFGYEGLGSCPTGWHTVYLSSEHSIKHKNLVAKIADRIKDMLKVTKLKHFLALSLSRFGVFPSIKFLGAKYYYASTGQYEKNRKALEFFQMRNIEIKPNLVLSHDYFTAPVAYEVAKKHGAVFSVDCHEYARGQYMHDPYWVRWHRPCVTALQDYYLARADAVTTVCDGIAKLLTKEHKLKRPAVVVRSTPFYTEQQFRPTLETITVMYHGEIYASRGLHLAVRSLRLWRSEFRLVLRGYSDPEYVKELWQIARDNGVEDRLVIEPPVPFNQIVPAANLADVGYFVHQDNSPQRRFTLPNKFFEYIMAGLALCVSDLPEMAKIVRAHGLGLLVSEYDEQSIADVINSLTRQSIDQMKKSSLAAARELNWQVEQERLMALYTEIEP